MMKRKYGHVWVDESGCLCWIDKEGKKHTSKGTLVRQLIISRGVTNKKLSRR